MTEPTEKKGSYVPRVAFIVSHTHWDREWYLTFDRFRVNLVRVVGQVLDALEHDDDFQHFLLDGQAIILEDYLEICPTDRGRIERLVKAGKLSVGPWYILPDEFLVSAEATVRNIQIGHRVGSEYGEVQKVGYMPDSFGHIAQMPQILRSAGIDSFVYSRGNGDEIDAVGHEYLWSAPDGSDVLAINQCGGYCNAGGLGYDEEWEAHTQRTVELDKAIERIRNLFATMAELSQGDVCLINNGCDHFPPQRKLRAILEALGAEFPDTEFRHASLGSYLDAVKEAGFVQNKHSGELVQGRLHLILSGVWSARMYLKQKNDHAQRVLSSYAEPFSAYMHFIHSTPYPAGLIDQSWKLLLQNHPHDSICGCSTDEVHRQMMPRFSGVIDTGEQIMRGHLTSLAPTFARASADDEATTICVANPLPQGRTEVVERLVVLQVFGSKVERLRLVDQEDVAVPFELVNHEYVERFWGIDYRTELYGAVQLELFQIYRDKFGKRIIRTEAQLDVSDSFLTIHFLAEHLPGVGHRQYYLRALPAQEAVDSTIDGSDVTVAGSSIENEYYELMVHQNGTFDLLDKATGRSYSGLNRLEDTEDVGDEYDYSPCRDSQTVTSNRASGAIRIVKVSRFWSQLEVEYTMQLPCAIEDDRTGRSKQLVDCRVRSRVGLKKGSRAVEVELQLENRAEDHRLRAEFPTTVAADTVVSDGHFYINHRPIDKPAGENWKQPPQETYPQQDFTLVQDGERGFAVLNKGLPEIQATRNADGEVTLSLTLLRAVGWLSRDDFETRRYQNAGPTLYTPEAQCLGEHRFEYAVVPFIGDYISADIKGISQRYRVPVVATQGVEDGHVPGANGLVQQTNSRTCVSAVKKHDVRDTLEIRLYNLTGDAVEERLTFGMPVAAAWQLDLLGQRLQNVQLGGEHDLVLTLGPHEIVTLELESSGL